MNIQRQCRGAASQRRASKAKAEYFLPHHGKRRDRKFGRALSILLRVFTGVGSGHRNSAALKD